MKTNKKCDLHVHTNYSYDNPAHNTMEQNVLAAIKNGVDVLCFTDHVECCHINTYRDFPFDMRKKEFDKLAEKYANQVKLLLGFEMGSPHHHPKQLAFLRSLEPDMIIGWCTSLPTTTTSTTDFRHASTKSCTTKKCAKW